MKHVASVHFRDPTHSSNAWIGIAVDAPRVVMLTASIEVNGDIDLVFNEAVLNELIAAIEETGTESHAAPRRIDFVDLNAAGDAHIIISSHSEEVLLRLGLQDDREILVCIPRPSCAELQAGLQQALAQLTGSPQASDQNLDCIERLNMWWQSHCDGEWEHEFGLLIQTMDKPGWMVKIDVMYTELAGRPVEPVSVKRSDMNWHECQLAAGSASGSSEEGFVHFVGMGGPGNLRDIIEHFLQLVEAAGEKDEG